MADSEEEEVAEVRRSLCMLQSAEEAAANTAWGPQNPHSLVDKAREGFKKKTIESVIMIIPRRTPPPLF